jgi:hypothetical protein
MTLSERLYDLRRNLDEQIDQAVTDNVNEICEAVGRVYDEYPADMSLEEEAYIAGIGAREALHSLLKELDIDPESVRKGWSL